jgi:signal transduction histidine kinase
MSRYLFLSILLLFFRDTGAAQTASEFHIRSFNTENGLPSNGIKGLQWDEQTGFLWIATEAGIVRYNGLEFKTYSNKDEPHITNERILFLAKNNQGEIYTADNVGNVFKINKNKLSFLETKNISGNPKTAIITICVSDKLYKSIKEFGTENSFSMQFNEVLSFGDTSAFLLQSGRLYFFSIHIPSPKLIPLGLHPATAFKCGEEIFFSDSAGNIYDFDKHSYALTKRELFFENGLRPDEKKKNIFQWNTGMKFPILFTETKAWKISYENEELRAALITDQVPQDALIKYIQYDDERKMLVIGTDSKGIIIMNRNFVESVRSEKTGINQRTSYYSQVELPNGNILTNEGHVLGKNNSEKNILPVKGRFNSNIFLMGDSLLWYLQFDSTTRFSCLHSYNYHTGITKNFEKIRENFQQFAFVALGNQLYIAKEDGIYRLQQDSLAALYHYPPHTKLQFDVKEIAPGILAIANCNSLLKFDINSRKLDTIFSSSNYCVRTIWQYNGYVFFGTYGAGLFIYKNGVVKPLPLDKNEYLLFTHCFVKDDNGYVWISTNHGLFKASIAELIDFFDKNYKEVYYYYYGRNDGMDMTEFNGGCTPCALMKKDKTISFPTMDGLVWVNPDKAGSILPGGEIYIDEILADNKFIDPDSVSFKELPTKTSEIIIRPAISAWTNKENIYLWFKLNDDSLWKPINIEKGVEIRFNNLPQGKYHLKIKKRNGFGPDNYAYKEMDFYITIPWYKRWWFYLLATIAIAALFMLYFNLRTRQLKANQLRLERLVAEKTKELQQKNEVLEKNDSIKTRLISIISHDIVTPLKFLTAAGKNLIEKRKQMPEELQDETITEMANTSQDLQMLSTNILNWIKYQNENRRLMKENFNLHELVNLVISVLKSLAKQKQNELVNNVDEKMIIHQYFEPMRIVIYNLVSNAINFTDQGRIIISSKNENGKTTISISDEGMGMTTEQIQNILADKFIISSVNIDKKKGNGLGYLIIKDLLKMMEGSFTIDSEKNKGTTVTINVASNRRTVNRE